MSRRRQSLKLLFITDPLPNFNPERETTLFLMHEAQRRGHEIYAATPPRLSARGREVEAQAQRLRILGIGKDPWYRNLGEKRLEIKSFDAVLLRKDPPFDQDYLHHLYLLDLSSHQVYMMNHPRGILEANEKLLPLLFPDLIPETLISADLANLSGFARRHRHGIVIKPINSSGGRGIFLLRSPDAENFKVILETATENFTRHIVAQAFLPEVRQGDKRILLLGSELLGAFIRKPARGEHRANLHAGGSAHPTRVQASDRNLISRLGPTLTGLGLDFVGLDVIGKYLTEVNVTSPMGLAEINATGKTRTQVKVIDFIEKKLNISR